MSKKPSLRVVGDAAQPQPPRPLGKQGRSLWDRVQREYEISDAGGVEILLLACEGLDRAATLRREIEHDGVVIRSRGSLREHPAVKAEIAAMAFVSRTIARLGLDLEPFKAPGRPPGM